MITTWGLTGRKFDVLPPTFYILFHTPLAPLAYFFARIPPNEEIFLSTFHYGSHKGSFFLAEFQVRVITDFKLTPQDFTSFRVQTTGFRLVWCQFEIYFSHPGFSRV